LGKFWRNIVSQGLAPDSRSHTSINPYESPKVPAALSAQHAGEHQVLATRLERFLGALIDNILAGTIFLMLTVGVATLIGTDPIFLALFGAVARGGVFLALNGYLLSTRGQTIGKVVMKTRIVSLRGELIPLPELITKRYLWLWAVSAIPLVGFIVTLVDALMIFRANNHCLHDDIAQTNVVKA
jgi:uncharacterized RDD family membrane protein YckC